MPRKPKFTREEVLASALEVARNQGMDAITASSVAANMGYTGSSLFTHFESMDEIKQEVYKLVKQEAIDYLGESINYFPAFKEFGLRWIRFAKKEPNFYRILFAGNPSTHENNIGLEFKEILEPIQRDVEKNFNISEECAAQMISSAVTCANGISLAIINGFGEEYTEERVSSQLSTICLGMVLLYKAKDDSISLEMAKAFANSTENMPVLKEHLPGQKINLSTSKNEK